MVQPFSSIIIHVLLITDSLRTPRTTFCLAVSDYPEKGMASTTSSLGSHSFSPCSANRSQHSGHHFAPSLPKHKWRRATISSCLKRNECLQLRVPFIFDHSGSIQSSLSIPVCVMHVERERLVFIILSIINYKCNSGSFLNTICKCSQRLLSDWCIK